MWAPRALDIAGRNGRARPSPFWKSFIDERSDIRGTASLRRLAKGFHLLNQPVGPTRVRCALAINIRGWRRSARVSEANRLRIEPSRQERETGKQDS
jgi:hypothetical protein